MRKTWFGAAISLGLMICLTGCGSESNDPDSGTASPTAASDATPDAASPGESDQPALYGRWITELPDGSELRLTLQEGTYRAASPGGTGVGVIAVRGEEIEFLDSNYCPGEEASYTWSIDEAGVLSFTPLGPDACGRADFLIDTTYQRLD